MEDTGSLRAVFAFPSRLKCLPAMRETGVQSLGWEDPLEKEMATHSSILAWKIPWMEEPGRLQSTGSQRVGHTERLHFHFLSLPYLRPPSPQLHQTGGVLHTWNCLLEIVL